MQFKWGCVASLDLENGRTYTLYLSVAGINMSRERLANLPRQLMTALVVPYAHPTFLSTFTRSEWPSPCSPIVPLIPDAKRIRYPTRGGTIPDPTVVLL
jgi:hypothetical protein